MSDYAYVQMPDGLRLTRDGQILHPHEPALEDVVIFGMYDSYTKEGFHLYHGSPDNVKKRIAAFVSKLVPGTEYAENTQQQMRILSMRQNGLSIDVINRILDTSAYFAKTCEEIERNCSALSADVAQKHEKNLAQNARQANNHTRGLS